jgi:hypothetical protein
MLKTLKLFARHHFTDRPFSGPEHESHFKIERLSFSLSNFNKQLKSLGARELASVDYQNKKYPIYCLDFLSDQPNAKKLFIVAGTHGNEQGGLLGIQQILNHLAKNRTNNSVSVRIVAMHNPVGCDKFSRYNGQGVDVNRDFKRQQTTETQAVAKAFDEFKPDFGVSLHEGPQAGVFLYTNKYCDYMITKSILDNFSQANVQLATKSYLRNTLAQAGVFPVKGFFGGLLKIWTGTFGYEGFGQFCTRMGIPSIVIETSWSTKAESQRTYAHYTLFTTLLNELS